MPDQGRRAHDVEAFEIDGVDRHARSLGILAGPLLALASVSGCGGAAVHARGDGRPSGDTPTPAVQSAPTATAAAPDPAEESEPIARAAAPAGAPRPPGTRSLFPSRGAARTPARVMEGVRRAVRERSEAIFACYAPEPCGPHGAEPSRVVLSLTVAATGEISPLRTLHVTHYRGRARTSSPWPATWRGSWRPVSSVRSAA